MLLIILGTLPPPRGGVTTHIERLLPYLEREQINYVICDSSKKNANIENHILLRKEFFKAMLIPFSPSVKVVHYPLSNIDFRKLVFLLFLKLIGIRITITLVASPEQTLNNSRIKLFFMLTLARLSSHIISTNNDFKQLLVGKGLSGKKISIIPAFIPANKKQIQGYKIPKDTMGFCSEREPVILTYAHGPDVHKGEDLYGLDLIADLATELQPDYQKIGFIIVIPEIRNKLNFNLLKKRILNKKTESLFYFAIGEQFSFVSMLKYADIFIRGTNTDGDALTLREALNLKVPSIASNVCPRPEGTVLFQNRSFKELCRSVRMVLEDKSKYEYNPKKEEVNNADLFVQVFRKTAGSKVKC